MRGFATKEIILHHLLASRKVCIVHQSRPTQSGSHTTYSPVGADGHGHDDWKIILHHLLASRKVCIVHQSRPTQSGSHTTYSPVGADGHGHDDWKPLPPPDPTTSNDT